MKLHLGCGNKKMQGWVNIDSVKAVDPDLVHDLRQPFPYADQSVSEILAEDLLEHFDSSTSACRSLVNGPAFCPSWRGRMTIQGAGLHGIAVLHCYFKFQFDGLVDTIFGENLWNGKVYIGDFGNHKWGAFPKVINGICASVRYQAGAGQDSGLKHPFCRRKKSSM